GRGARRYRQGGQPETVVLARVLLVADADQGRVEQIDRRREHLFTRQPARRQVLVDATVYARQAFGEIDEALIFRLVAHLVPFRMIEILLAVACIASRRLDYD